MVIIIRAIMLIQVEKHSPWLTLVLVVDQSSQMMSSVPQVLASYQSVLADQFCHTTAFTLLMLVWGVKVCFPIILKIHKPFSCHFYFHLHLTPSLVLVSFRCSKLGTLLTYPLAGSRVQSGVCTMEGGWQRHTSGEGIFLTEKGYPI